VVVVDGVTEQLVVLLVVHVRLFRAEVSNLMKILMLLLEADLGNSTTEKFSNFRWNEYLLAKVTHGV